MIIAKPIEPVNSMFQIKDHDQLIAEDPGLTVLGSRLIQIKPI